jgi:iron-sulfur cluster assembly protein
MKAPVTVSDRAVERIHYLLEKRGKPSAGIKVAIATRGCSGLSYKLEYADAIDPTDTVITQDGVTVLLERKSLMFLIGTTMDYVEENLKSGFVFVNPNEKGRCGCGESFHV